MFHTALLLLPAVAYAQISILVETEHGQVSRIYHLGSIIDIISDTERLTWQIPDDNQLKDMVEACSGRRPDDVFIRNPSPRDVYKKYGRREVQRTLRSDNASILDIKYESVIVATQEFINNSKVTAIYDAGIWRNVNETMSTTWRKDGELTVGHEISYSFILRTSKVPTYLSLTDSWGKETSIYKSFLVGSEARVMLKPNETVISTLIASRGSIEVQVNYTATLDGVIACNNVEEIHGRRFFFQEINGCLAAARKQRRFYSNVVYKAVFYTDVKVVVAKPIVERHYILQRP